MAPDGRWAGLVLVLVGLGLFLSPLYAFPHATETSYYVGQLERVETANGSVVAFEDLPPAAQSAVRAELSDREPVALWSHDDREAITALTAHESVRYDGAVYSYQLGHVDRAGNGVPRTLLAVAGGFVLALGALGLTTGAIRPGRPEHGLVVVAGVAAALAWVTAYEVAFEGRESLGIVFGSALYGSLLAFVVGVAVRRRSRRWIGYGVAGAVLITVAGGIARGVSTVPLLLVVLPVVSLPWLLLGFTIARPGAGQFRDILHVREGTEPGGNQ